MEPGAPGLKRGDPRSLSDRRPRIAKEGGKLRTQVRAVPGKVLSLDRRLLEPFDVGAHRVKPLRDLGRLTPPLGKLADA